MPARVGKAPWYTAATQSSHGNYNTDGMVFSGDVGGWHAPRKKGWKNSKNVVHKQNITSSVDGKIYTIYKTSGYDDFIHFHDMGDDTDALDYAIKAFGKNALGKVIESDGAGHIKHIAYAVREQILRVRFAKGADCFFFRVPSAIGGMLVSIAQKGPDLMQESTVDKTMRHTLGINFWNLVRVRGTVSSTRYPFAYGSGNVSGVTSSKKRYTVRLTPENIKVVLGNKYKGPLREGDLITTVLSEDEYKQYLKQAESQFAGLKAANTIDDYTVSKNINVNRKDAINDHEVNAGLIEDFENIGVIDPAFERIENDIVAKTAEKEFSVLSDKDLARYKELQEIAKVNRANRANTNEQAILNELEHRLKENPAFLEQGDDLASERASAASIRAFVGMGDKFDQRYIDDKVRTKYRYEGLNRQTNRSDFNSDAEYTEFKALDKEYNLPLYTHRSLGKYWTTSQLRAMADPNNPMSVSAEHFNEYSKYINKGDYRGALTFLKNNSPVEYVNGKQVKQRRYAQQIDKLARQEIQDD